MSHPSWMNAFATSEASSGDVAVRFDWVTGLLQTGAVSVRYVIVDLEATCWEQGAGRDRMETIEIGAVLLASSEGPVVDEFDALVRPIASPQLSEFCKRLTSIRQEDVDRADPFDEVFPRFLEWIGQEL